MYKFMLNETSYHGADMEYNAEYTGEKYKDIAKGNGG